MIKGVGIDLIEIQRVKKALKKWDHTLEKRILTPEEIRLGEKKKGKAVFLAGRFAAKEAIFKSLGINPRWQEVLVLTEEKGQPVVNFSRRILKQIREKGVRKVLVSISHSKKYAIAQAIALE
jgi:holo-[acyl-carrier protein] synthase